MDRKMMLLAAAATSAALFAMPAVSSAGEWTAHNATGKTFTSITKVNNPVWRVANTDVVTCTGVTGGGEYTSTITGTIALDFTGCIDNTFGFTCKSTGAVTAGTIQIPSKVFHNVIIGNGADSGTPIGMLVTGGNELVTFTCGGVLTFKVTGNMIGEFETPNCGVAGTTYNVNFEPEVPGSTRQRFMQITTTGGLFDLISEVGGTQYTTSLQLTGQIHLSGAVTPTCS
ncbi:MAG TPA: hypothetical protein VFN92_01475 [Solirubrobacterales bacterium]|nr:hypothetical protein [Solirubrobacterales bacterium]